MNATAVQEERGPRMRKCRQRPYGSASVIVDVKPKGTPSNMTQFWPSLIPAKSFPILFFSHSASEQREQLLCQILVTCIRQARSNEHFRQLGQTQQNQILRHVWSELFVLRASHWPIDISPVIARSVDSAFCSLCRY